MKIQEIQINCQNRQMHSAPNNYSFSTLLLSFFFPDIRMTWKGQRCWLTTTLILIAFCLCICVHLDWFLQYSDTLSDHHWCLPTIRSSPLSCQWLKIVMSWVPFINLACLNNLLVVNSNHTTDDGYPDSSRLIQQIADECLRPSTSFVEATILFQPLFVLFM